MNHEESGETIGLDISWFKSLWLGEGMFPSKAIEIKRTQNGLEKREVRAILLAACGKRIHEEEIGGTCSACRRLECKEHLFNCYADRVPLCFQHVHFLKTEKGNIPFCRTCYERAAFSQNLWNLMEFIYDKRKSLPK